MSLLARYPQLAEAGISLAILAGSYIGARAVSYLLGKLAARAAARSASSLDDHLVAALQRPLTYSLLLAGAWLALHRLPLPPAWSARLDAALYLLGVLLVASALLRSYGIAMSWYMSHSRAAAAGGPAGEFGPLFSRLGQGLIVLLAVIAVLQHLGVNVASLVVSLGVGSLAVGLAAQDTLANMFAGFTLMLDRPFHIGDRIQLASGEVGDVQAIGMRATEIRTLDDNVLVVPNGLLVKDRVVNQSRPSRQIVTRVEVGVAYGTDLASAKRILVEAALASARVAPQPEPVALVTRFADLAITLRLVFWARDYVEQGLAVTEVHEEIDRRYRAAGIEIPSAVRTLIQAIPAPAAEARSHA